MTRAAIYARYSSELQSGRSIDDQVALCRELLAREGVPGPVPVHADAAESGAFAKSRAGLQRLLEEVKEGKVDLVVAEALDRISRDQEDIAAIWKRLLYAGARLVTVAEGEVSELHVGLKGTMNALFLKDLAQKVRRGQSGRIRAGRSAGGVAYGYRVVREIGADGELVRGKREIDEKQAEIVRRIFRDYAAGTPARDIAAALNAAGVPSPRGGPWNASTINGNRKRRSGILFNEIYIGVLIYNRLRMVRDPDTGKRLSRSNGDDALLREPAPHLRIVDDETWRRAQARKDGYAALSVTRRRRPRHLLSGLLVCGECGSRYTAGSSGRYRCSAQRERSTCTNGRTVKIDDANARLVEGLRRVLLDEEFVETFVRSYNAERRARQKAAGSRDRTRTKRLGEIARLSERIIDSIAEGTDTPAMRKRLMEMEEERLHLEAEAAADAEANNVIAVHPNAAENYRRLIGQLEAALNAPDGPREAAGALIRSLVDRIEVEPLEARGTYALRLHGRPGALLALAGEKGAAAPDVVIPVVAGERYHRYHNSQTFTVSL